MNKPPERALPFIELQAKEIAAIISPVVQAVPEELQITPLPGSLNTSFRVKHPSRDLMVRLITGDLNAYVKEFNLLSHYAGKLPVPAPVHFQISTPASRGVPVVIHDWIEGITLEEFLSSYPQRTATVAQSVGRSIALFANISFPYSGFLSSQLMLLEPFNMNRQGYLDYVGGLLSDSLAAERLQQIREPIWQYISRHAKCMDSIPAKSNLVNGNFRRSNLLVNPASEQAEVVGVLNWDFAMSWTSLFDISQLLDPPFPKHEEFERELLQAYANGGGRLPEGWTLIKNLFQLLSWSDLLARPATLPTLQRTGAERIAAIIRG
jgi:aminoglycoside phosphotransferase (APT) family kinase protein